MTARDVGQQDVVALYLELLKKCLTREFSADGSMLPPPSRGSALAWLRSWRSSRRSGKEPFDPSLRREGRDWPSQAETMIGRLRLDNLQKCVERVVLDDVPGDLIETGVWRGGATILMRGVLKAYGDRSRCVWVADSFAGLPKPDPDRYPRDAGDRHWAFRELAVSVDEVKANFDRYGLLDDRVRFLAGLFSQTLPVAPIERLAVARLDGDMYESTMDGLRHLYPKLSLGGYLIVDDFGAVPACQAAVMDYRAEHRIDEPVETIDWTGVYWRRTV